MCGSSCLRTSSSAVFPLLQKLNDLKNHILKSNTSPLEKNFGSAMSLRVKEQQTFSSHFMPVV